MKTVKCKSGITGWMDKLQKVYANFEEFESYDEIYNIVKRLGFSSTEEAWEKNPKIQGSSSPSDLCVVPDKKK